MTAAKSRSKEDVEDCLDKALAETFPTSDPPSCTNPSRGTKRDQERLKDHAEHKPTEN